MTFEDPVVTFQHRANLFMCFSLSTLVPVVGWNESALVAFLYCGRLRCVFTLTLTWLVISAAHFFGYKPSGPWRKRMR